MSDSAWRLRGALVRCSLPAFILAIGLAGIGSAVAATPGDGDWPQFRGPSGDGHASGTGLARSWGENGPPELWRREIGSGFSSVASVGDRLYTMTNRFEIVCLEPLAERRLLHLASLAVGCRIVTLRRC